MRRLLALLPISLVLAACGGGGGGRDGPAGERLPATTRCRPIQARPRRPPRATRRSIWTRGRGTVKIGAVKVYQREAELRTAGGLSVRDITDEVNEAVRESDVIEGIACIYSPHTTCCVRVNEFETGFIEDFSELLRRLVPRETYYAHDDWDKRTENICPEDMDFGNGHSHCMAMLLGSAGESVPVREGELCLGTWQRVLFIELDRERDRRWLVQVVGN
jgi:secondary thiamine-phosphate synthase enzyme